jgi:hypothetical protein
MYYIERTDTNGDPIYEEALLSIEYLNERA